MSIETRPEGDKSDILQRYAFQPHRKERLPRESDTPDEASLYDALRTHFVMNATIKKHDADTLRAIMDGGKYKKIFHAPRQEWVFRGMIVKEDWLRTALKLSDDDDRLNTSGRDSGKFTFTPKRGVYVTSWSTDGSLSDRYALSETNDPDAYGVVMSAEVADNPNRLIACDDGLYNVRGYDECDYEHEVLALGPIHVQYIAWFKRRN